MSEDKEKEYKIFLSGNYPNRQDQRKIEKEEEEEEEEEEEMEGEMVTFVKVWGSVIMCLCYCYGIGRLIPKGIKRLICVIPIVCLFLYLPLCLTSVHLGGTTAFFIAWLSNFKLLLFAFGLGPLSPSISLPLFLIIACYPIKIQHQIIDIKKKKNGQSIQPSESDHPSPTRKLAIAIKVLFLGILVRVYDYSDYIVSVHPKLILLLYAVHIYFMLELILAMTAALARAMLAGLELEPQFNEPYLSTSLQDFWGKRWNLMVSSILRPTVYEPARSVFTTVTGRKWAPLPAVFATFLASGFMHELMFFHLTREVKPTWEVTWFFVLHGACLVVEIALKSRAVGVGAGAGAAASKCRWRLPRVISGALTVGFVMLTACWLFFPQLTRCQVDKRAFEEYAAVASFFKHFLAQLSFSRSG